ncbi:hypothetical protein [Mycolicibacterium iranicum]|nr:hypothetical protein [Mycolicibacterium iranicum]
MKPSRRGDDHKISEKLMHKGCRCHCAGCKSEGHCHNIAAGCNVPR